jgi:NAD(P)-dependent dehydrogenase (short-subunit alcohol dehydrogenase family)
MSQVRIAIVTGAAQGIGRAIALRLADDGLDVAINDLEIKRSSLQEIQAIIIAKGRKSIICTGDVSSEAAVKSMVDTVVESLGGLDVVSCGSPLNFNRL